LATIPLFLQVLSAISARPECNYPGLLAQYVYFQFDRCSSGGSIGQDNAPGSLPRQLSGAFYLTNSRTPEPSYYRYIVSLTELLLWRYLLTSLCSPPWIDNTREPVESGYEA